MSRTGETLVDIPEATVRVLVDLPELVLTYMRSRAEGGPGRHLHREHADGFIVLEGEYAFELGDERAPRGAGTAIVIPRDVIHRYEHETTEQGQFLNIHAPGMGFAEYLFGEGRPRTRTTSSTRRRTAGRRARRPRSRSPMRARWSRTDPSGRSASSPTCRSSASRGRATSRARRAPVRTSTRSTWTPSSSSPASSISASGPDVERVHAGPGTFVLAPPERGPHVPERRARGRDLAQFPRTFQGFRELPPRSGLRLG